MGAQNVWNCICFYRSDTATQLQKAYGFNIRLILEALASYTGKDAYHGHASDPSGSGDENPGATTALNAAIAHLRGLVPSRASTSSGGGRKKKKGKGKGPRQTEMQHAETQDRKQKKKKKKAADAHDRWHANQSNFGKTCRVCGEVLS